MRKHKALTVSKLMGELAKFSPESEVYIESVVNADDLQMGEDWSENENLRDIEAPAYDVSEDKTGKVTIWF